MRPIRPLTLLSAAALLATLAPGPARADDKDLLKIPGVKPNVLIVFGNSQTTTNPLSATTLNSRAWDGDADSPSSKLGLSKRILRKFVQSRAGVANFGLSRFASAPNAGAISFARKHWVYQNVNTFSLTDGTSTFTLPAGVIWRIGSYGEGPCTTATVPACTNVSPAIPLPATAPKDYLGGSTFFGARQANKYQAAYLYLSTTVRVEAHLTDGLYGDAFTDGSLSTMPFGTYSLGVSMTLQKNTSGAWNAAASQTAQLAPYRPAGTPVSDLFFTTDPDAGKAIGYLQIGPLAANGNVTNPDFSVNASCAGWWAQSNVAPLPLVRVPRDYVSGANCDVPPQNSVRCIKRILRPQGVLVSYKYKGATDNDASSYWTEDHDNQGYTGAGSRYADGCDANLLGATDPRVGLDFVENQAIVTTQNGSQAPIKNLLTDIYKYLSDPSVDGFLNGKRQDDPSASCRQTAVILIYDNFNGCQNDNCGFLTNMNGGLAMFASVLKVPIYVIGLGASASGTSGTGYCIAQYSGATIPTETGTAVGYFPVTSPDGLELALGKILGKITESTKDFASASISSVQAGGEQMAYLATFNASKVRSIWDGRISGYKVNTDGSIPTRPRTITDANDAWNNAIVQVPSNSPDVLKWNAGENLVRTPGTGATDPSMILAPGDAPQTGTYADDSTNTTEPSIPTWFYPTGRKLVFSLPQGYAKDADGYPPSLPMAPTASIPEDRLNLTASTTASWWPAMRALLGPQLTVPTSDRLDDVSATEALRFIWGDRDSVTGATDDAAKYLGKKLGDTFHSNPALVGPPANFFYWSTNSNGYKDYVTAQVHRRRVLFAGANDGLLHAFDVGVWNRTPSVCGTLSDGTQASCFDLGTGLELFAYAPRTTMPIFSKLRTAELQDKTNEWTVDGAPSSADVFIDPVHSGTPAASNRQWRTVVVGTVREGSPFEGTTPARSYGSVYALDVTQPDVATTTTPTTSDLFKAPSCLNGGTGCSGTWPAVLWEISDRGDQDVGTTGETYPDMGETWSKAGIGRVKVCPETGCTDAAPADEKFVAIFGGGFDRERKNRRGNWLYMVDIETGNVLYRANTSCGVNGGSTCVPFGSVAAEPAVLDVNGDGYLDVVYFADLKGQLWRLDLSNLRWGTASAGRWTNKISFTSGSGKPFLLFSAPQPSATTVPPNQFFPIYQRPVVFLASSGAYGIGFGTGDRDDILADLDPVSTTYPQRFYVVLDRANTTTFTEASLTELPAYDPASPAPTVKPEGWFLKFGATGGERLITDPIALQAYLFFSTFRPIPPSDGIGPCNQRSRCGQSLGRSMFYAVSVANGNPAPGLTGRSIEVPKTDFVTNPIAYQSADMQTNLGFMTASGGFEKPKAPKRTTSSVREWKER